MRRYYQILGVSTNATQEQIKEAWIFSLKAFHPDKFSGSAAEQQRIAHERTKAINEAYQALARVVAAVRTPDGRGVNVRFEPKQLSNIVATLHQGDRVFLEVGTVVNSDPPEPVTWRKVTTMSGHTGWIRADYLSDAWQ